MKKHQLSAVSKKVDIQVTIWGCEMEKFFLPYQGIRQLTNIKENRNVKERKKMKSKVVTIDGCRKKIPRSTRKNK